MNSPSARTLSFQYEKRILAALGVLMLVLAVLYGYFLAFSIAHTVERERLVQASEQVVDRVASLEHQYLSRANKMTERVAYAAGFVPVSDRLYVERGALSLNISER